MKLSNNLSLSEVVRSESAKRHNISNMPTPEHIENLKILAENIFQPIRDHFGVPIRISSGYRSAELNKKIGGANKSDHLLGKAIDIDQDNTSITNAQVFDFIKNNLKFSQLIWEFGTDKNPDWVHVSYDPKNLKCQILKAIKQNGKTVYI
jgi:hypothetical protein